MRRSGLGLCMNADEEHEGYLHGTSDTGAGCRHATPARYSYAMSLYQLEMTR